MNKQFKIIERTRKEDLFYGFADTFEEAERMVKTLNDMQIHFARLEDKLEPEKLFFILPPKEEELVLDL